MTGRQLISEIYRLNVEDLEVEVVIKDFFGEYSHLGRDIIIKLLIDQYENGRPRALIVGSQNGTTRCFQERSKVLT